MANTTEPILAPGIYQHYKGPYYQVLDLVRHSETQEWLVYYRTCYGDWDRWVRPYEMFIETLDVTEGGRQRFKFVAASLHEVGLQAP